jgi:hypothetical protein
MSPPSVQTLVLPCEARLAASGASARLCFERQLPHAEPGIEFTGALCRYSLAHRGCRTGDEQAIFSRHRRGHALSASRHRRLGLVEGPALDASTGRGSSDPDRREHFRTTADCRGTADLNLWQGLQALYRWRSTKPPGMPPVSADEITAAELPKRRRSALPAGLPPRGLSLEQAAEYCGLSAPSFLIEVAQGRYPDHLPATTRRQVWDRFAIDRAMDLLSGLEPLCIEQHGAMSALHDADRGKLRAAIARKRSERR